MPQRHIIKTQNAEVIVVLILPIPPGSLVASVFVSDCFSNATEAVDGTAADMSRAVK